MPVSEAQKRANAKYRANGYQKQIKRIVIDCYPPDHDIYEWASSKENRAGYIKQLIREDMKKSLKNPK